MRRFNSGAVEAVMNGLRMADDVPIESKMVSRQIQNAQTQLEQLNAETRKDVLKYDDIDNKQRMVIYAERDKVLQGEDMSEQVRHMIDDVIEQYVDAATADGYAEDWNLENLWVQLEQLYPISITVDEVVEDAGGRESLEKEFLHSEILADIHAAYDEREREIEKKHGPELMRHLERMALLVVLDEKWRAHLYEMDYLRDGITLRGYGQRDPLVEYQREAFDLFSEMLESLKEEAVFRIFHAEVEEVPESERAPVVDLEDPTRVLSAEEIEEAARQYQQIRIKGLDIPRDRDQHQLRYSAPSLDGDHSETGAAAEVAGGGLPGERTPAGQRVGHEPSRNAPCPCGSGKKFKKCHGAPGAPAL